MSKMVQIRNVPDDLHRRLKSRAAVEGLSLSDFLLREAERALDRARVEEVLERIRRYPPVTLSESSADAVRAERDAR